MKKLKLAFKAFFDVLLDRVGNVEQSKKNLNKTKQSIGRVGQVSYKAKLDINKAREMARKR